jgi:hypothetical protein
MLELAPVEYLQINDKQAYGEAARVTATFYDLTFPYYIKGYVFNNNNSLATALLLTSDSERFYWESFFRNMIRTLH